MKHALVIYNPISGATKWTDLPSMILSVLQKHNYTPTWFETIKTQSQPLDQFRNKKFDRIIVAGGDGTVSEVASFIIRNEIKTPLVILPTGSANVLAHILGIPVVSTRHALERGLTKRGKQIDAILVNNHFHGLITVGTGYDALLMKETPRALKRAVGFLAYGWTILKTFLIYKGKPYRITVDGKRHQIMAKSVMVFNMIPFGHLRISKKFLTTKVTPTDGMLNVIAVNPRSIWDFMRFQPRIRSFKGKKIIIKPRKDKTIQIDGESIKSRNLSAQVIPNAIKIVHTKKFR